MGSDYYLTVLIDTEDQPNQYPTWLLAIIREYADDSEVTRAVPVSYTHLHRRCTNVHRSSHFSERACLTDGTSW